MDTFTAGDKVTSRKLGPGVWEVTHVYESNIRVTMNGISHIRPTAWFAAATPEQVRQAIVEGQSWTP